MEKIAYNPYRVLGVFVGSPLRVEMKHLNQIRAFSMVGQEATFQLPCDDDLGPLHRTEEMATAAAQTLALPLDRLNNALLWFSDGNSEWGKPLNMAVKSLIDHDLTTAINGYENLISDDVWRGEFLEASTNGLLKMTADELADKISDIIMSSVENFQSYWYTTEVKPSGLLAKQLFEKSARKSVDFQIKLLLENTFCIDFYECLSSFQKSIDLLKTLSKACGEIYGYDSLAYKNLAEDISRALYVKGNFIVEKIGNFVWKEKERDPSDSDIIKYTSKMPASCIRACMGLIRQTDDIIFEALKDLKLDETSQRILYTEFSAYEKTVKTEYVNDEATISESVRSFYLKRGIIIILWLALLGRLFFYL